MQKMLRKFSQIALVILLLLAATIVRVYKIEKVPPNLYYDEVDYGYQAQSLIETGKDYRGKLSPFYVHSFNDIRTPIPAYFTALSTLIFKTPELEVRGAPIILGMVSIVLIFLLTKLWTKNLTAATIVAATFAFNPWQIQFSRFGHEVASMMVFYLLASLFFYQWHQTKKYSRLLASVILFSLSVYTYRTMGLFIPLTFLALFLLFRKELLAIAWQKLAILPAVGGIIILPFLAATTIFAPDQPRIAQLSITSDPAVPVFVQRDREVDSGDLVNPVIGKKAALSSYFFHSKPLSWLDNFTNNYLAAFGSDFLFVKGDANLRHSVGKMGELLALDFVALIAGAAFLVKNFREKQFQWLLIWLILAPIPAALTIDGAGHATRLFIFSAPLLVIAGLGWWHLFENFKNYPKTLLLPLIFLVWLGNFTFYLHRYFVHYPIESARDFSYGFKLAMEKIAQVEDGFARIGMVTTRDPPMIYYLFWSATPPYLLQEYGSDFSKERISGHRLDKYKIIDWPSGVGTDDNLAAYLRPDTLYFVSQHEFSLDLRAGATPPAGVRIIDVVKYPDNTVAFYLLARVPNFQPPPSKKRTDINYL